VLVVHPGAELFGSDRMLLESVRGLGEAGFDVVVALPSRGPLVDELTAAGASVRILPMFVLRKKLLAPSGWPALLSSAVRGLVAGWRLLGRLRPETVYVSTIILPQWPLLARFRGVRSVSHVHEAERSGSRMVNRLLYLPHLASRRTLVNSRFSQETIRWALPALAKRSEVIYNGVASPPRSSPPREPLEGPLRVLYMGRLSPRKGVDLVLEAAELLRSRRRQVKITLLGTAFTGYEWYEDQLREQAAGGDFEVEFAGFHNEIWPFLAEADVLIVPSRTDESFGNTAVEGILAQRPVIASSSSGLREAAGGYPTTRLVPPDDAPAIAEALIEIADLWPFIVEDLPTSRERALRRHSPHAYRAAVARACTAGGTNTNHTKRAS
jgi:glycosyltransferase involved in cell wall biosynthesis